MDIQTVAVDFDGTIFPKVKWTAHHEIPDGPPTPGTAEFMRALLTKGYKIVVFSVRAGEPGGIEAITNYLSKWGLLPYVSAVTAVKPPAVAYVDDKGVAFDGNWLNALHHVDELRKKQG